MQPRVKHVATARPSSRSVGKVENVVNRRAQGIARRGIADPVVPLRDAEREHRVAAMVELHAVRELQKPCCFQLVHELCKAARRDGPVLSLVLIAFVFQGSIPGDPDLPRIWRRIHVGDGHLVHLDERIGTIGG